MPEYKGVIFTNFIELIFPFLKENNTFVVTKVKGLCLNNI